ncbi:unnamed protein product, partial [Bubo scandiacus]
MGNLSEPHFSIPKPFQTTVSSWSISQAPHNLAISQTEHYPPGNSQRTSATRKHLPACIWWGEEEEVP